jgi:hypothetical protein
MIIIIISPPDQQPFTPTLLRPVKLSSRRTKHDDCSLVAAADTTVDLIAQAITNIL